MNTPQIVIYTDNTNATLSSLATTECTIGIQAFISGATFGSDGTCTLSYDWPMQQAIAPEPSSGKTQVQIAREKGLKVLAAVGGETFSTSVWHQCDANIDGFVTALTDFVTSNNFDGIDIDWEDSAAAIGQGGYNAVDFLVSLTQKLKEALPTDQNMITHAPQPPYLDPEWYGGPYLDVMRQAGDDIDYLNIQYYNNPAWVGDDNNPASETQYVAGTVGSPPFSTSIVGLQTQGLKPSQLLIGKPTTDQNSGSGYISASDVATYIIAPLRAASQEFGGVMGWQYAVSPGGSEVVTQWISTISTALNQQNKK
ncbi:Chitinase D precursor [Pseudovibrio axinellae]|uniref:chitinase n=1 Tax=Pseudovibrio axinellae TaxID=989403 RepID=A0A161VBM2_9HYPH|nr:glycosyl hydrolase family 18 protein [Pseudovibrio axinellae]KZL21534.1 Chitinase D precursor [Pseudovibrio axinellae]SER08627.1 Glycosyl hydrolases family 18 [Pseudovibrio axinellae]